MCKYYNHSLNEANMANRTENNEQSALLSTTHSSLPKVLLALIRLEKKAQHEYSLIQTSMEQVKEMEILLNKLVVTHIHSDDYSDYLFKRAEQLSNHLETYKNIIGKIDIGEDIRNEFKLISFQFFEYLKKKIEFKSVWIDSMQTIENGRKIIKEKLLNLDDFKQSVDDAFNNERYFDLHDLKTQFDNELEVMNDLVDNCFQCGQHSTELSNLLYDKLTELEVNFRHVVRESMNKITEIKQGSNI